MRADADHLELLAIVGLVVIHCAIGPAGDEERFSVGVKENAIGSAARFEAIDNHAGLRIHNQDRIVIKVASVEQAAVRRNSDIADEIAISPVRGLDHVEGTSWLEAAILIEREFVDRGSGAATHP